MMILTVDLVKEWNCYCTKQEATHFETDKTKPETKAQ